MSDTGVQQLPPLDPAIVEGLGQTPPPVTPTRRELRDAQPPRRRRWVRWLIAGIAFVLLFWVLWIGIRGLIARDRLAGAIPLVHQLQDQATSGETARLQPVADELAKRADTAHALTSDSIWRATELIPGLGKNLTAFRQAAEVVDRVTSDVMPPLLDLAGSLDFGEFLPKDGAIDVAAVAALQPKLATAGTAMQEAQTLAGSISTEGTVPQIGDAVGQLVDAVQQVGGLVVGLDQTVQVLPALLGADGPQRILLLVQNNAELRLTGGIPGAIVELEADHGRLTIVRETGDQAFGPYDEPIVPLSDFEQAAYSDKLARWMQNVTMTPDFARTGEIAAAMWKETFGEDVDAIASIDPVALSYLLQATGPVEVADGTSLTSQNVVQQLLNETYLRFPDAPKEQDAFFGAAAGAIFEHVMDFDGDPKAFIGQLAKGVADRRVYLWSADPALQSVIAGGTLSSLTPTSDASTTGFGVYLADLTMSKLDYYVTPSIAAGATQCGADSLGYYQLEVTMTSSLPAEGDGLPDYITGPAQGDARGTALTAVYLVVPEGYEFAQVVVDGVNSAAKASDDPAGPTVYEIDTQLKPGATTRIGFRIWGPADAPTKLRIVHTPTAGEFPVNAAMPVQCPVLPTDSGTNATALGR